MLQFNVQAVTKCKVIIFCIFSINEILYIYDGSSLHNCTNHLRLKLRVAIQVSTEHFWFKALLIVLF